jgi:hypothetical protein
MTDAPAPQGDERQAHVGPAASGATARRPDGLATRHTALHRGQPSVQGTQTDAEPVGKRGS